MMSNSAEQIFNQCSFAIDYEKTEPMPKKWSFGSKSRN